jgi:group I intron endonuclease
MNIFKLFFKYFLFIIIFILYIFPYFLFPTEIFVISIILPFIISPSPKPLLIYKDLSNPSTIISICQDNLNKSGIYGFYLPITNKIYIGSAQDLIKRFKEHIKFVKSNRRLINSIKKYGLSEFYFLIFEYYLEGNNSLHSFFNQNINSLIELETLYLKSFNKSNLFNFKLNGTSLKGYKHTKKSLELMSMKNTGKNHPMYGLKHSEETKEKIRNSLLGEKNPRFGIILSDKTKLLIANNSKGIVEIRDINNNLLHSCKNATVAAKIIGIHKSTVGRYIKSGKIYNNKYYFILLSKK